MSIPILDGQMEWAKKRAKLCKDCIYLGYWDNCRYGVGIEYELDLVTGRIIKSSKGSFQAETIRSRKSGCGEMGEWYVRKWWKFWRPK